MESNYFAKNLFYLRKKSGKTQADIALYLEMRPTAISSWEKNESKPRFSVLDKLSNYFGISTGDLLGKDLSDVNLNYRQAGGKNTKNVNLNVNQPVNLNAKKGAKTAPIDQSATLLEDSLTPPQSEQNLVETMATAIRGLERANARLEQLVERLEEENRRLKSEIPSIGQDLEAGNARAS